MTTLVAGVGIPWAGDLDLGPRFVRRFEALEWPAPVALEDAAVAAHVFLHRLVELRPERVVLVAAHPRGGVPGTVRRYRPTEPLPPDDEVQARLGESAAGVIDLDHTLVVARFFGALPQETTIVEVEPHDASFGTELSDAAEAAYDAVLAHVRKLVG